MNYQAQLDAVSKKYSDDYMVVTPPDKYVLRRGIDKVHSFVFLKGPAKFCLTACETGWWIVGVSQSVDAAHEDRGPYDTFETAATVWKLIEP